MPGIPGGLTVFDLQQELKAELEELLTEAKLPDTMGRLVRPKIYIYDLPVPLTDDDSELSYMPYIIIRANGGTIENWDTNDKTEDVTVLLLIGTYNADPKRTGAQDLMVLIQRIKNHFGIRRRVKNFTVGPKFQWVLSEQDTHPYYFGGVTLTFEAPRTIKEDELV